VTFKKSKFPVKRLSDGRAMVNLGSSARSAPGWNNIDSSWLVRLGKHRLLCSGLFRIGLLSTERYGRITSMDKKTILWDLSKGIPFADQTFDVVYHCHVIEHIDRDNALDFVKECYRVLKTGGGHYPHCGSRL
jgi:SAM-dependent methyltransferase